jgi:5'-3' exonuclease
MINLAEKLKEFSVNTSSVEPIGRDSKVLLVDGLNSYLRCFAATPTMDDNGEHVGGMTGFLRSIGQAIRQFKPSRVVIVFDGKGGSARRRAIFKDYKEGRKMMEKLNRTYDFQTKEEERESQKRQLHKLIAALQLLPVTIIIQDHVEADDVLAYLARLVEERGGESIIMSTDKDFLQLTTEKIKIWNPIKKKIYNVAAVTEEYGIHPNNFIIYRTIDGDDSDKIPGVKGVGLKTLKKNFPELENETVVPWEHMFAVSEEKDSKVCKLILENKQLLERNTSLMRLDEQQMSGQTKMNVLNQFDGNISTLNKLALTQLFSHDRLLNAFPTLDEWLMTTFVPLSRHSKKD